MKVSGTYKRTRGPVKQKVNMNIKSVKLNGKMDLLKRYKVTEKHREKSSKTFKKQMEAINRRLARFEEANLTANNVTMYKNLIKAFNKKHGYGSSEQFNPNKWYTRDEQKEIRALMRAIREDPETKLGYWKDTYKKIKELGVNEDKNVNLNFFVKADEKFDFQDEQEFIDFVDELNRFRSSDIVGKILDSDQYRDLVELAEETGYSEEFDIDELILSEHKKTGKSYVSLYNHVFDILMNYQKYGTVEVDEE